MMISFLSNIQYVMKSEENIWYLVVRYKLSSRYLSTHDWLQASWYKMLFSINQEDNKSSRCDQMVFTQFESIWFALYKSPTPVQDWTLEWSWGRSHYRKKRQKFTKPNIFNTNNQFKYFLLLPLNLWG